MSRTPRATRRGHLYVCARPRSPLYIRSLLTRPRSLQYILPKMPKAMTKRVPLAPGQERSVTVHIKSLRNPPLDIKLTSQPLNTSILDVRNAVVARAGIPADKIKVLHKKKPVADSKVLKDLLADEETSLDLSVMVIGGAASVGSPSPASTPAADATVEAAATAAAAAVGSPAQGPSGEAVLQTDEFWTDLRGFLLQRLRDEKIAEDLFGKFLSSWDSSR